ncbi:TPA: lmo0937 family membrane protein [Candidatus Falkowbacteria bacterium]|nr:MAG: hypothetical protein UV95_C0001G0284 [Candidatus Falkowbacteria bacterium GW2011_GWF2_43_32]HBA36295.1 lmo0937 family membrane protein [Candidatus Falkowbacteria bacterium]
MLYIIGGVLVVLWLLGFIVFPILGGFIHFLLALAIILFLIRIIRGK